MATPMDSRWAFPQMGLPTVTPMGYGLATPMAYPRLATPTVMRWEYPQMARRSVLRMATRSACLRSGLRMATHLDWLTAFLRSGWHLAMPTGYPMACLRLVMPTESHLDFQTEYPLTEMPTVMQMATRWECPPMAMQMDWPMGFRLVFPH
jgi:hypothetical protein